MAEEGADKDQKTEAPTSKRLEEAVKRGQVPFSREVVSFLMLAVFTITLIAYVPYAMRRLRDLLRPFLSDAQDFPTDTGGIGTVLLTAVVSAGGVIAVPLLAASVAAVAASVFQNGFVLSAEPIKPKFEKISIVKGLGRMFSMRAVIEFLKGLFKIGVVGAAGYFAVSSELHHLRQLPDDEMLAILLFLGKLAFKLMIGVCIAMFFIALADFAYQRFEYIKNLRMSKQEIKDEYKQQEGDPIIKQKLRQIRMERARKRMMAEVPKADVVITNPTHFAVALKYENDTMQAPLMVAKGQDNIALKIREVAKEHDVPVVENPPLARALYDGMEIGDEIPVEHYQAVAEVISYVWKLKGKKAR